MEVVEQVEVEQPAIILSANNAVGPMSETPITWNALRSRTVGTVWEAIGGGHKFDDCWYATLVYSDKDCAVLLIEHDYSEDSRRHDKTVKLQGFHFAE